MQGKCQTNSLRLVKVETPGGTGQVHCLPAHNHYCFRRPLKCGTSVMEGFPEINLTTGRSKMLTFGQCTQMT